MEFKVGDKVRFLNDVGEGVVTRILEKDRLMVENSDGFEIPVAARELVPVAGSYENRKEISFEETLRKPAPKKEKKQSAPKSSVVEDDEIILAFTATDKSPELRMYLVNSSSWMMYYTFTISTGKVKRLVGNGMLEDGLKIYLGKYLPSGMDVMVTFTVQALLYKEEDFIQKSPLNISRSIPADDLFDGKLREKNDYFDDPALIIHLETFGKKKTDEGFIDPGQLREAMLSKKERKHNDENEEKPLKGLTEVDLHIENLIDEHKSLSPGEIIDIQISKFRIALESAMLAKEKRIVFIHGVGNGKLKYEIRKILDQEYKELRYQDASFREYGYGATMVYIK